MRLLRKKNGFTLIEMIVVISILAIMVAVSIPAYRSYGRRNELRNAAQQVRQALVEAQNMALAPKAGVKGYGVHFQAKKYFVFADKNFDGWYDSGVDTKEREYSLPSETGFAQMDPVGTICFQTPTSKAYIRRGGDIEDFTGLLTIGLQRGDDEAVVTLHGATGKIEISYPGSQGPCTPEWECIAGHKEKDTRCGNPPRNAPDCNSLPTISRINIQCHRYYKGMCYVYRMRRVRVSCTATDPDGDRLRYSWRTNYSCGYIYNYNRSSTFFIGRRRGKCSITVTVTDPYRESATKTEKVYIY